MNKDIDKNVTLELINNLKRSKIFKEFKKDNKYPLCRMSIKNAFFIKGGEKHEFIDVFDNILASIGSERNNSIITFVTHCKKLIKEDEKWS
jgi:hypothetical protein